MEVSACYIVPRAEKFKFTQRRMIERIAGKPITINTPANLLQPSLRPLESCKTNGAADRDHRRRTNPYQRIIQSNDLPPVSALPPQYTCLNPLDLDLLAT